MSHIFAFFAKELNYKTRVPGRVTGNFFQSPEAKFSRLWRPGAVRAQPWSEIGTGFVEPGGTPLPRIPRSTLPEQHLFPKTMQWWT